MTGANNEERAALEALLRTAETGLRTLQLWQAMPPPAEALASQQPFAVDTLTFPQWLQFLFLPRLYALLEAQAPLPTRCEVAPMAEEYFKVLPLDAEALIEALRAIDRLLSQVR